jgi:hypothetical protein
MKGQRFCILAGIRSMLSPLMVGMATARAIAAVGWRRTPFDDVVLEEGSPPPDKEEEGPPPDPEGDDDPPVGHGGGFTLLLAYEEFQVVAPAGVGARLQVPVGPRSATPPPPPLLLLLLMRLLLLLLLLLLE